MLWSQYISPQAYLNLNLSILSTSSQILNYFHFQVNYDLHHRFPLQMCIYLHIRFYFDRTKHTGLPRWYIFHSILTQFFFYRFNEQINALAVYMHVFLILIRIQG